MPPDRGAPSQRPENKEVGMDAARKEKLGRKWECYSCTGKFYDLKKPEPICPRCGADQRESPVLQKKPKRKKAAKKTAKKAVKKTAKKAVKKRVKRPVDDDELRDPDDATIEIDVSELDPGETVELQVETD